LGNHSPAEYAVRESDPSTFNTQLRKDFFDAAIQSDDFLKKNFLSDDRRYPLSVLHTNAARAMGHNVIEQEFVSQEFFDLPPVKGVKIDLHLGQIEIADNDAPDGGRGYYRTPSLFNLWASAPFLHTNAVGINPFFDGTQLNYDGSTDTANRNMAFEDGMKKLLGMTDRSQGQLPNSIVRLTERASNFELTRFNAPFSGSTTIIPLPILKGLPVDLIANLAVLMQRKGLADATRLLAEFVASPSAAIDEVLRDSNVNQFLFATDVVLNKGHEFGTELTPEAKLNLIAYLKTL
jgi:hypothetical protein